MAKVRTYICPHCQRQFDWMIHPSTAPECPEFCPLCGVRPSDPDVIQFQRAITAPHIAKSIGKAGDMTYRQMEEGSLANIQAAAEMTGQPESDFADMKITNLKDGLREGDIAAVAPPPSEVSSLMASQPQAFGFQGPQASAFGEAVRTGPTPYAGLRTALAASDHFRAHAKEIVSAGETNRF